MALVFPGFSKCAICEKVIEESDDLKAFPAFIPYDHKYGMFSDASLHRDCYTDHPDYVEVENLYAAFNMILNSRPKHLKTLDEIEDWRREAFKDWPPKNGVVIFQPMFPDESSEEGFYMDADDYKAFCEMEDQYEQEREERRKRRAEDAWRYSRND